MNIRQDFTPMEWGFRDFMRTQKCPFRITEKPYLGTTIQEMMPCDPDCLALLYSADDKGVSYSCLRLMRSHVQLNDMEMFMWEPGTEEGETNASE